MSDIYLTGQTDNNVLNYAAEIDGKKIRGRVPATSDFEAEIQAAYKVIQNAVMEKGCRDISFHSDLKSPVLYLTGTKAMGDVSKTFVRNVNKLVKMCHLTISADTNIPKDKADKLYQAAFSHKEDKPAPAVNPFSTPKRDVSQTKMKGWANLIGGAVKKPQWSVKVIKDDKCIIDLNNHDFRGCDENAVRKDAIYLADWWEQVEGATVVRNNLPARENDFSNYKGFNGKAIDIDKDKETIWKNGEVIYSGKVMRSDKEDYAKKHPDSRWAKELAEEAAQKEAEDELFGEIEKDKSEQLSIF